MGYGNLEKVTITRTGEPVEGYYSGLRFDNHF